MIPLFENEIHLWVVPPSSTLKVPGESLSLLNLAEKEQKNKFVFLKDQGRYLATRVYLRTLLSQYAEVDRQVWEFVRNSYGRPEIGFPVLGVPLFFNLSHSKDCLLFAISRTQAVGVDVEFIGRPVRAEKVAERFFSAAEVHALKQPSGMGKFFHYWTLKEAYVKARGMGLSLPFDQFSLRIDSKGGASPDEAIASSQISISFAAHMNENPSAWHFQLFSPALNYLGALAAMIGNPSQLRVIKRRCLALTPRSFEYSDF